MRFYVFFEQGKFVFLLHYLQALGRNQSAFLAIEQMCSFGHPGTQSVFYVHLSLCEEMVLLLYPAFCYLINVGGYIEMLFFGDL